MAISLLPDNPGAWTSHRFEDLYAIPREEREKLQLEAVRINFARMRGRIPALTKQAFKPALAAANLPAFRLYDLRHSHATLLLSNGENPKVASERLGHSTIVLTLDTYSHVLPDMQEEAAKRIEKILFRRSI